MQQKVSTSLGLAIVLVTSITIAYFVWLAKEKEVTIPTPVTESHSRQGMIIDEEGASFVPNETKVALGKTYRNEKFGFSFKYPSAWIDEERGLEIANYFKAQGVNVLQIELDKEYRTGSLADHVKKKISERGCLVGDRIIQMNERSVLYVEYCSASSESYIYEFLNHKNKAIIVDYHDDFDSDVLEIEKIETLKKIVATIELF